MKTIDSIGIQIPQILLPRPGIDLHRWAVIACDQFTSQPEYWDKVKEIVGSAPSTLNLILPEVYLEQDGVDARVQAIQKTMARYLEDGVFKTHEGIIYVERSVNGKTRKGILICIDLECYDYNKGSQTLIRATEGTIIERLPPRIRIRQGAPLELPHILVLIDDPAHTVIEPIAQNKTSLTQLYDFDLMQGSGHLSGYLVNKSDIEEKVIKALEDLANPQTFKTKYQVGSDKSVLLFAIGDGNHSLATAKAIWEKMKSTVGMDHPARYALVEIENVHDQGLEFEPIHRVLFGLKKDIQVAMKNTWGANFEYQKCASKEEMIARVNQSRGQQIIGYITSQEFSTIRVDHPAYNLPVGTLQAFLDTFLQNDGAEKIDYVHGEDVVCTKGSQAGNAGFYLPAMNKDDLFKTVILDGALPRKTFSMGEAEEKRFYLECRKIA